MLEDSKEIFTTVKTGKVVFKNSKTCVSSESMAKIDITL